MADEYLRPLVATARLKKIVLAVLIGVGLISNDLVDQFGIMSSDPMLARELIHMAP